MSGLRITGGRLAGRRFRAPRSGARPTSDRVRESLFARLGDLTDVSVLDVYAGSGALGFEAVSRGAVRVVALERAAASLAALRANVAALDLREAVEVMAGDAVRSLNRLGRSGRRFDLVLADPPYASGDAERTLEALVASGVLAPGATVVLERGARNPSPRVRGLDPVDERRYGDTVVARFAAAPPEPNDAD